MPGPGFNPALIVAAAVGATLAAASALRTVLVYSHPDDARSAWLPRGVAAAAFTLASWTVLLLPLDVASRKACGPELAASLCAHTIPAKALWQATAAATAAFVLLIIPVAYFYYLGDSDDPPSKRLLSGLAWAAATAGVAGAALGLAYAFGGVADLPVTVLASGFVSVATVVAPGSFDACVAVAALAPGGTALAPPAFRGRLCDAVGGRLPASVWSVRVTLPTYAMAFLATAGWALFALFGGAGLVLLPADAISAFASRSRATIGRAEYAKRASALGARAGAVLAAGQRLRAEARAGGGARALAAARAKLQREVALLEDDADALEAVHPRGENAAAAWAATVAAAWLGLARGVVAAALTAALAAHLALAVFPRPPVSPVLNEALTALDGAAPLLGTAAFGGVCFYLVAATVKGAASVGLGVGCARAHPMRAGATHASSLLFNAGLVLLATGACVQFAAAAFGGYAGASDVGDAWGGQLLFLRGLGVLYRRAVFLYALAGVVGVTLVTLPCRRVASRRAAARAKGRDRGGGV